MSKVTRVAGLLLAVLLVGALVMSAGAQDDMKVLNYTFLSGDIPSIDPSLGTDTSSIQVVEEIFIGLTRIHEEDSNNLQDGFASLEISEDGLTYTFHLLEGVPWVRYDADAGEVVQVTDDEGNPIFVTANDFVYGILRSIDPATASYYGGVMAPWIVGGAAASADEGSLDDVAVTAIDDYTLEIQATEPAAFLANIFGMWMAVAQPQWVVEEFGDSWTEPENIQTYGPFAVKEWLHDESFTLVKNPFWPGTDAIPSPALDEISISMLEESAQLANYEAGLLDVATSVPLDQLDRIKADDVLGTELNIGADTCTYSYMFNTAKAPFDDARVRQAFSMAIDRELLIENVLKAGQEPAFFWTRPDLTASPKQEDYPEFTLSEDDEAAKALIDEYVAEVGEMAPITLMHNTSEGHARIAAAVQQMWAETLGIDNIDVQNQEWAVYLETIKSADAPQIFRYAWCWDYPDAHSFIYDVFHSSVRELGINWEGEAADTFDTLLDEAKVNPDVEARIDLYAQAENILSTEEAILAPIYYYTSVSLSKPYLDRTFGTVSERFEKWDIAGE